MWLIFLEAALALLLFVFIVWWTMFHGRRRDPAAPDADRPAQPPADPSVNSSASRSAAPVSPAREPRP